MSDDVIKKIPCSMIDNRGKMVYINQWCFEKNPVTALHRPDNIQVVCYRCSGPYDYYAEWQYNTEDHSYRLVFTWYEGYREMVEVYTPLAYANTIGEIMVYCAENVHPNFENVEFI
jgi:hypothetical protein